MNRSGALVSQAARLAPLGLALVAGGCLTRVATSTTTRPPFVARSEVAPDPSPGCPEFRTAPGWRTLWSGGRWREYLLRVPRAGEFPGPRPLVLNFHGLLESARMQEKYSFMTEEAARRGFVVAYPEGIGWSWNAGSCCGRAFYDKVPDVQYARDLVDAIEREQCIDRNRVYATGMSNGAIFSYRLACEAADVFAAIAPVAGTEAVSACAPSRPVPVMAFHGTWDPIVPYGGGAWGFPSVDETVARWQKRDGCQAVSTLLASGDSECDAAQPCQEGSEVILCTVKHGGHTWPGGGWYPILGKTSADLDATSAMLDFFLAHPKR